MENKILKFITGNKTKVQEVANILAPIKIEQLNLVLPEIQELDIKKVLKYKLVEALKHYKKDFFIEDSALYFDCLGGKLPGPLVKWFNSTLGSAGQYQLAIKMGNVKALAKTSIAYCDSKHNVHYFDGLVKGTIVKPKGTYLWGYDEIFLPNGSKKTLSEQKSAGIFNSSPRGYAFTKFKKYLEKNEKRN